MPLDAPTARERMISQRLWPMGAEFLQAKREVTSQAFTGEFISSTRLWTTVGVNKWGVAKLRNSREVDQEGRQCG